MSTPTTTTDQGPATTTPTVPAVRTRSARGVAERFALLGVWLAVLVVFSVLRPETYPTAGNLQSVLGSQAVLLIVALGVLLPLTTGEFDLSVASTLSLSAMVTAVLNVQHGWGIAASVAAGLGAALVVGAANAVGVVRFGIPSFIVTLGSGTFALGVVQWISGQTSVTGIDPALVSATVGGRFLGVPLQFYVALLAAVLLALLLEFTPLGRRLLFVGATRRWPNCRASPWTGCAPAPSSVPRSWPVWPASCTPARWVGPTPPRGSRSSCPRSRPPTWGPPPSSPGASTPWARSWPCTSSPPASWVCRCWGAELRAAAVLRRRPRGGRRAEPDVRRRAGGPA